MNWRGLILFIFVGPIVLACWLFIDLLEALRLIKKRPMTIEELSMERDSCLIYWANDYRTGTAGKD
jgi:hypothetical protein